jgi:hypothetical protein
MKVPLGRLLRRWQADFNRDMPVHLQTYDARGFVAGLCEGSDGAKYCYSGGLTAMKNGDGYTVGYGSRNMVANVTGLQLKRLKET